MFILQIERRAVESHLQVALKLHLDLACVKLSAVSDTQKKFEETTKKLEKRINALEKHIHYSEEKCESSFTWRIDGFSEVLRKAKSGEETRKESSPFYRYGYKFKLSINPNGDYSGKNTHLSVHLIIMKGEYDAMLTWPFHKKVTFTLIDQQEKANDREDIVMSFVSDPKHKSFGRPVTEDNIGMGFDKFVSHKELKERRFTVDDAIFIQFQVTSPE